MLQERRGWCGSTRAANDTRCVRIGETAACEVAASRLVAPLSADDANDANALARMHAASAK
jgi:hypothetical protein